jgi:hypothetical protein
LSDHTKKSVPVRSPLSLKGAAGRFFLLGLIMGVLILPALASFGLMLPDWMNR